ncbi:MAG: tRNA (guanosine(46)-N7)-methyltransferase TrmB, partial [Bacteroidales bacterium]|nr:tRNA (guanosine(46)-N7)-methyltransferase TrmB [Bacteroidales bacterium]
TSSRFLTYYQNFLTDNGIVNLKTDDDTLYEYTKQVIARNNLPLLIDTGNLYESEHYTGFLTLKTHYEKMWNKENRTIKYLRFRLPQNIVLVEPEDC